MSSELEALRARFGEATKYMQSVRHQLQAKGISLAAWAREAGVDPAQITRWSNGTHRPSLESLLRLDAAASRLLYG